MKRCFVVKFNDGHYLTTFDGDWGVTAELMYAKLFANPHNAITACKMANDPLNGFAKWYDNLLPACITTVNIQEVTDESWIPV